MASRSVMKKYKAKLPLGTYGLNNTQAKNVKINLPRMIRRWKVLRGDKVLVIAGKDKGKQGTVKETKRLKNRLTVEGVNLQKRRIRKTNEGPGKFVIQEGPIHYSNVKVIDPNTNKPTKISWRYLEDGKKVRVNRKTGDIIPKPAICFERRKKPDHDLNFDTDPEDVAEVTFKQSEIDNLKDRYLKTMEKQYINHLNQIQAKKQRQRRERLEGELILRRQIFETARDDIKEEIRIKEEERLKELEEQRKKQREESRAAENS
eukprot:gb/GECH01012661.1/.p1 GENE.gb/GECH01012661.1/~~gb/GECH01012661.1/.p1  ORF type:complete len:261 (+),score=60.58 gb/GECH01012661.1/:1-783(+)